MNKYLVLVMISIVTIFYGCEKSMIETVEVSKPALTINFEKFSLSVENNTLVFSTENDLYECFDYLSELGDKHFDEFEKAIGFSSFRTHYKFDSLNLALFNDDLYKTLLNHNREIIVSGYIFCDDPLSNKIYASELIDGCSILHSSPSFIVDRDQDVFSVLKGSPSLKNSAACPPNHPDEFEIEHNSRVINCKIEYSNGIIKYLKASMSRWYWGGGTSLLVTTS